MVRPLVFLHIPKAAGTTLRSVIRRNYRSASVLEVERDVDPLVAAESLRGGGAVIGHLSFRTYRAMKSDADAITVLRHPIDRLVSEYFYVRRRGAEHRLARYAGSLAEFAASGEADVHNAMTRQLGDTAGVPDAAALAQAKHNLLRELAAFGTDDRFDESLLLFQRRLGWQTIYCARENAAAGRPSSRELDASALRMLERNNELDLELWELATRELSARLAAQPAAFHDELRAYRRRNGVYSRLLAGARRLPKPMKQFLRGAQRLQVIVR